MKNVPTFKNQYGNYIYKKDHVEILTNAVYSEISTLEIENRKCDIIDQERNDNEWIVTVAIEGI